MTVFDEMKVASEYWTGYKPELIDEACERGNKLEKREETNLKDGNYLYWRNKCLK